MAYVTAKKVAEHFGFPLQSVYAMARKGEIPSYKLGGSLRFVIEEIEEATRKGCKEGLSETKA